jgi:hypothetical protein
MRAALITSPCSEGFGDLTVERPEHNPSHPNGIVDLGNYRGFFVVKSRRSGPLCFRFRYVSVVVLDGIEDPRSETVMTSMPRGFIDHTSACSVYVTDWSVGSG